MKTICGMSVRGAAYFTASTHICIGVVFFALLLDRMVHQIYYRNLNVEGLKMDKESVIYFGLFLPLGILIFKAIDKENKTLLKWAAGVFLTLQLFGIIIRIKFGHMYASTIVITSRVSHSPIQKIGGIDMTLENFKILTVEIVLTAAYLVILYLYVRHLQFFPGRIYGHHHSTIPMYSTSSSFFNDHRSQHHHQHQHHNLHRMGPSPYTYNFEPPPPYSSVNNLATSAIDSQGQIQTAHAPQQPGSSRTSVFSTIGRNISAFKKNNQNNLNLNNNGRQLQSNVMVNSCNNNAGASGGVVNSSSPASHSIVTIPSESDCPSAPLLESSRHSAISGSTPALGVGCGNNRRRNQHNSLSDLKNDIE